MRLILGFALGAAVISTLSYASNRVEVLCRPVFVHETHCYMTLGEPLRAQPLQCRTA